MLIALLALVGGVAVTPVRAQVSEPAGSTLDGLPIVRIELVGNTRSSERVILDQVRAQVGQPYSRALVLLDVKSISILERFDSVVADVIPVGDDVRGTISGVVVRYVVVERSLVASVEIAGNRVFTDTEIREGLAVRPGTALDGFRVESDRRFILDQYKKKGYAQASVDVDQGLMNTQGVVRYQIIEGPQSKVSKIEIDGNVFLKDDYIKWRLETKTYIWIFRKGILEDDKIQRDMAAIRDMYRKKGFLDVRVSYTLDFNEDKSKVVLHFVVLEGVRYRIGKLNVNGNNVIGTYELLGATHVGPGDYAERDKLEVLQRRIEDAYGKEGYIYRTVVIEPAYTETPGIVDIDINVTEGEPYVVGRVIVRGNSNVQDRVVRRQIRVYPDQTFDMVQVKKSLDRLRGARIFNDVNITAVTPPGNPRGVRDVLVEVSEGQTGKFAAGAGLSTNSGLAGQFSLEQQNFDIGNPPKSFDEMIRGQGFKGAGQYFRILLEPGTEFQRYRLTFAEPYLFDTPYSFSNDLFFFTRGRESWDERRIGDVVTFGRRFGDAWAVSVAIRAEQVTLSNPVDHLNDRVTQSGFPVVGPNGNISRANDTAQEILDEIGSHFIMSLKPAISYDMRDNPDTPSDGYLATLSVEQYGGDTSITKILFNFNWYYTLNTDLFDRKTILSIRNEVGVIPFGESPTFERFYLGGIGDLRGFRYRGVSPRSGPLEDPIGGDFSWATTVEVSFPLYENLLRGVVFVDVGTVESDIGLSGIRADAGAGIRVKLPFLNNIPVSLDLAYPVSKQRGDRTQLISVSLGIPF